MSLRSAESGFAEIGHVRAIDGLRALAVCAVVLFHAVPNVLPAGLVGVDIFFVVSGFVVPASILARRFESAGAFAAFFFARRLRRIAPALIVCLLVSTLATVLFVPRFFFSSALDDTALAAFFGLSNVVLAGAVGDYLSPEARENPFTQTWSLAVEEQFYLLFPLVTLLLAWLARDRRKRAATIVWSVLTIASALLASVASRHAPMDAFYLTPPRLWELGFGLVAYLTLPASAARLARAPSWVVDALAVVALAVIAASLVLAQRETYPYPAVLPVVAATAVLVVCVTARPACVVARLFAWAPLVAVGRISFSLYLWHWPVFVLLRWTTGFGSPATVATGLALAVALAILSYRFVETPVRTSTWISARPRAGVVAVGVACLVLAWGMARLMIARQSDLSLSVTAQTALWDALPPKAPVRSVCTATAQVAFGAPLTRITIEPSACTRPLSARTLFVLGDSHAIVLARALSEVSAARNVTVRLASFFGCAVLPIGQTQAQTGAACDAWSREELATIAATAKPGDVLLLPSLRLSRIVSPDDADRPSGPPAVADENRAAVVAEAGAMLRPFAGRGVRVVFAAPEPLFRSNPFRCADWFDRGNPACANGFDMPRATIETLRAPILERMRAIAAAQPDIVVWDPLPLLCDPTVCWAMQDGKPLFFDGDHLSGYGNDLLAANLATALFGPLPPSTD